MKQYLFLSILLLALACSKEDSTISIPIEIPSKPTTPVTTPSNLTVLKSGKFNGANGYPSEGTAQLTKDSLDRYSIRLAEDFTTSFATGSVTIYLATSMVLKLADATNYTKLGIIDKKGMHNFALEGKPSETFSFVIVWCQPAGVKFGHAEMKQ